MKYAACAKCGKEVSPLAPGVWNEVTGWKQNRTQGGANQVALPEPTGRTMHAHCFAEQKIEAKHCDGQQIVFGGEIVKGPR